MVSFGLILLRQMAAQNRCDLMCHGSRDDVR